MFYSVLFVTKTSSNKKSGTALRTIFVDQFCYPNLSSLSYLLSTSPNIYSPTAGRFVDMKAKIKTMAIGLWAISLVTLIVPQNQIFVQTKTTLISIVGCHKS